MRVTMFQKPFVPLIETGVKRTTIRPRGKHYPKHGEARSLRYWSDKPYRSPQVEIMQVEINRVANVIISSAGPQIDGFLLSRNAAEHLAKEDGFQNWEAMLTWFLNDYPLPFCGVLIGWK